MRFSKIAFKIIAFAIAFAVLCSISVSAAIPYTSFTYDSYGNAVETADLYEPDVVVNGSEFSSIRLKQPTDMFVVSNKVFILDSGNSRIVVLNDNLELERIIDSININGEVQKLQKASRKHRNAERPYRCTHRNLPSLQCLQTYPRTVHRAFLGYESQEN